MNCLKFFNLQFHEESALAANNIILSAEARKDPVYWRETHLLGRNHAAQVRKDGKQTRLSH